MEITGGVAIPSSACLRSPFIILADVVDLSISIVTGSFWNVSSSRTSTGVSSKSLYSLSHSCKVSQAPQLNNLVISHIGIIMYHQTDKTPPPLKSGVIPFTMTQNKEYHTGSCYLSNELNGRLINQN